MFGTASADLQAGARNAVEVCLAIRPEEHVALIADEATGVVAAVYGLPAVLLFMAAALIVGTIVFLMYT